MRQVFNPHTGKPDYIVDPDTIARSLYGLGVMVVVAGPMVAGTDPPQMAPSTAGQVAHLLSIGIPEAYIGWNVTGSETGTSGSFALPSVTLTPVIIAPSLSGAQGGSFTLPSVTLQPQVVAPTLTGVQVGSFALPAVTMQPLVSAPTLFGVQAGVGVFALPTVTLQPQVTAPTLAGVQVGSFALPAVTVQPQVSAPSLAGSQVGTFALPAVTLQPSVAAPTLTASVASTSGAFTLPAVTLQPVVTAPTLTGVSGVASFSDSFNDLTLNTTEFGALVNGLGVVSEGGAGSPGLTLNSTTYNSVYDEGIEEYVDGTNTNAAAVICKTVFSGTKTFTFRVEHGGSTPWGFSVVKSATPWTTAQSGAIDSTNRIFASAISSTAVQMGYISPSGLVWLIDAAATINAGDILEFVLESTSTQFRMTAQWPGGAVIGASAWTNWSLVKSVAGNAYLVIGDYYNDIVQTNIKLKYFARS